MTKLDETGGLPIIPTSREDAIGFFSALKTGKAHGGLNWARRFSLFQYPFVTACCGMEYMSISSARFDMGRFGAEVPRFTPRQADLLMVVGTITHKQAPVLRRVWEAMPEPRWVMAFGVCASTGGFYQNYTAVEGIDRIIPVDVYVPGCPPRPEQVIDALMLLQDKVSTEVRGVAGARRPVVVE
ncbi:MAG: NADH-quinone oxidoreductase subunit B [Deltaproteobacteria bacterium]|nr:NADH-quinone oxidoreductase subunit B [Deltaproteobacteria bacterium]